MNLLRKGLRFPFLPIWLAALVLLAPLVLSLKALFWGTPVLQFAPWWSFAWRTLLSGRLPLWNPLVGMGAPLLANYQSGLLYPPYWITLLLYAIGGDRWMAWGMAPLAALHLAWAGLGMALLARRLGLGELPQAVSGLAFGLSGYLVARLGFLSINAACAWLPWILLLLTPRQGEDAPRRKDFPWLALCLALLLLAGHAQTAWYTLLLAVLWVVFWAWRGRSAPEAGPGIALRRGAARLAAGWSFFALAMALAVGIAAVQLLPTAEYLAQSQRATAVDYDYALNYSFWPWHLLTYLAPALYGSPVRGDYWLYGAFWEDAVYLGLLPFLLALSALIGSLRRTTTQPEYIRPLSWFMAAIFSIALALSLGKNTPLFPWLYRNVPTFAMFQAPARWMIWAEFALALLAGLGAERWRRPQGWGLYWTRLGTMGAVAVAFGAGLTWRYLGDVSPSFIRSAVTLSLLGVGAGLLSLNAPPDENALAPAETPPEQEKTGVRHLFLQLHLPQPQAVRTDKPYRLRAWQWAVTVFVALDLIVAGWGLNPGAPLEMYGENPGAEQVKQLLGDGRLYLDPVSEDQLKYKRFFLLQTFDIGEDWLNLRAVMLPNTHMLNGVASANNFDPLVPGRFADWMNLLEEVPASLHDRLLRLMGVTGIESLYPESSSGVGFSHYDGKRLRMVSCAVSASGAEASRNLVTGGGIDFDRQVIAEGLPAQSASACALSEKYPPAITGSARLLRHEMNPNVLLIETQADSPAWLVISEVWYPGRRALVDGRPVQLYRADYLFMGVLVPQGAHQVRLVYQPLPSTLARR